MKQQVSVEHTVTMDSELFCTDCSTYKYRKDSL